MTPNTTLFIIMIPLYVLVVDRDKKEYTFILIITKTIKAVVTTQGMLKVNS